MKGSNYACLAYSDKEKLKRLLRNKILASAGGTASIFYKNVEEPNAKAIRVIMVPNRNKQKGGTIASSSTN